VSLGGHRRPSRTQSLTASRTAVAMSSPAQKPQQCVVEDERTLETKGDPEHKEEREVRRPDVIARLSCAGLKLWIAPKAEGLPRWSGSGTRPHASTHGYSRPPAKSGTKTETNCYFGPGTQWRSHEKKSNEINGRGEANWSVPAVRVRLRVR